MLLAKCATWGAGPVGTIGDGCDDTLEYSFAGGSVAVILGVTFLLAPKAQRVRVFCGLVLAIYALHRLVFGEGTLKQAVSVAEQHSMEKGVAHALLNSREVTVTLVAIAVAYLYPWWATKTNAMLAGIAGVLTSWEELSTVMGVIAFTDAFSVFAGLFTAFTAEEPKSV